MSLIGFQQWIQSQAANWSSQKVNIQYEDKATETSLQKANKPDGWGTPLVRRLWFLQSKLCSGRCKILEKLLN